MKRERAIAGLADGLDASQIPDALAATARLRGPAGETIRAQLLRRWGELDHESALKYALASGKDSDLRVRQVIAGWAEADEAAAESWAASQERPLQDTAWHALAGSVAEVDPEHALVLAAKIKDPNNEALADEIFGKWAQTAPAAAAARAEQLAQGELRKEALALVARKWAEVDLAAALAWAGALPDEDTRSQTSSDTSQIKSAPLVKVLNVWLDRDPSAAVAWLKQMPDPSRQLEVCKSVIDSMKDFGS